MKVFFRWAKVLLLLYALVGIGVYYLQEKFLFHPEPMLRSDHFDMSQPHHEINIPFDATSNLNIVQFHPDTLSTGQGRSSRGVVLYFHGNRKNISWYAPYTEIFTRQGYHVWMIDYPGFGKSTGALTEKRLYDYASQLYRLARRSYGTDSILLYGKSLGTGIAAQLASSNMARLLILETPYYSIPSLFSHYLPLYPVNRMIKFKVPTHEFLQKTRMPIVIFQGTDDGVVPFSNAKKLETFLKPGDKFIRIEGGTHNDLTRKDIYQQTIDSLLLPLPATDSL